MSEQRFTVLWTEAAVRDLEGIAAFIAHISLMDAEKVLTRLEARAATLTSTPGRGRVVPELALCGLSLWRELVVKPHRILYRIDECRVYVVAVLDSRRDIEDLLLQRLVGIPGPSL